MKKVYTIKEEEFEIFWKGVMKKKDPFDHKNVTYYEHNYEKKIYIIKIK